MLVKIEDGFYLNTVHIIAIRIAKSAELGTFQVNVEYSRITIRLRVYFKKLLCNSRQQSIICKICISRLVKANEVNEFCQTKKTASAVFFI